MGASMDPHAVVARAFAAHLALLLEGVGATVVRETLAQVIALIATWNTHGLLLGGLDGVGT